MLGHRQALNPMASNTSPEKLVSALMSGLAVLRHLAASSTPLGVTRIAKDLELNASTCFNLLKTLVHEGLVNFDEATKTYSVGLGLVELANGALEQASYVRMIQPYLQEISSTFQVTATLWHRTRGNRVVLLGRADNEGAIRVHMNIGQRLPMYLAALGRCMAAHSGLSTENLRKEFEALRWETQPTFEQYLKDVERARKLGYAAMKQAIKPLQLVLDRILHLGKDTARCRDRPCAGLRPVRPACRPRSRPRW
jgi:DNA-binding IclR family transcriptional regulator